MLFGDKECKGPVGRFYGPHNNYRTTAMTNHNIGDNNASSMMIPYGLDVTLINNEINYVQMTYWEEGRYDIEKFSGEPFINDNQEMRCINLVDFNDKISALRIQRSDMGHAKGNWELI